MAIDTPHSLPTNHHLGPPRLDTRAQRINRLQAFVAFATLTAISTPAQADDCSQYANTIEYTSVMFADYYLLNVTLKPGLVVSCDNHFDYMIECLEGSVDYTPNELSEFCDHHRPQNILSSRQLELAREYEGKRIPITDTKFTSKPPQHQEDTNYLNDFSPADPQQPPD